MLMINLRREYDVYNGPWSPKRAKKDGSWRPWASQSTVASGNDIHVSTPDRRTELFGQGEWHEAVKQQATPGDKTI